MVVKDDSRISSVQLIRQRLRHGGHWYSWCAVFVCILYFLYNHIEQSGEEKLSEEKERTTDLVYYKKDAPLIWIGGIPSSGTTLMRAMLESHPQVRCGEETRIIPRILGMHNPNEFALSPGIDFEPAHAKPKLRPWIVREALAAFLLSVIAKHGDPAPRLCNKDPFIMATVSSIYQMFPKSKFILMLRDGRAVVHSIITRKLSISGFNTVRYYDALRDWNTLIKDWYDKCQDVGPEVCLPVYYEQLVLQPEAQMKKILEFLDLPWNDQVLHHHKMVGKQGGISLSRREYSTEQVIKPVSLSAIYKWAEFFPEDLKPKVKKIAPALEFLGYDPEKFPPDYGKPDELVVKNSEGFDLNHDNRKRKLEEKKAALLELGIHYQDLQVIGISLDDNTVDDIRKMMGVDRKPPDEL